MSCFTCVPMCIRLCGVEGRWIFLLLSTRLHYGILESFMKDYKKIKKIVRA